MERARRGSRGSTRLAGPVVLLAMALMAAVLVAPGSAPIAAAQDFLHLEDRDYLSVPFRLVDAERDVELVEGSRWCEYRVYAVPDLDWLASMGYTGSLSTMELVIDHPANTDVATRDVVVGDGTYNSYGLGTGVKAVNLLTDLENGDARCDQGWHLEDGRGDPYVLGDISGSHTLLMRRTSFRAQVVATAERSDDDPLTIDVTAMSTHAFETMAGWSYEWRFGDGTTRIGNPLSHTYAEPGSYLVLVTHRDDNGAARGSASVQVSVGVTDPLVMELEVSSTDHRIGEPLSAVLTLRNDGDETISELSTEDGTGLVPDPQRWEVSGPVGAPLPTSLAPNSSSQHTVQLTPRESGALPLRAEVTGTYAGEPVQAAADTTVLVAPDVTVAFSTSVTSATKVGDNFDVIATVTNHEAVEVSDVKAESLAVDPAGIAEFVIGPLNETGNDPRLDPVTIAPGGSAQIRWTYAARARGDVTFSGAVSARDPYAGSLFFLDGRTTVAVEAPALEITDFRMQPGSPVPGQFGNMRGTVTNVGSVDVTGIDFEMDSNPRTVLIENRLNGLDPSVSPRIAELEPGESQEFLIPFGLVLAVEDFGAYTVDLKMTGNAEVGGQAVDVETTARAAGPLDLSAYWTNLFDQVGGQLRDGFFQLFEGLNDWGDSSTLGGVTVGGTEGVIAAFQKMGDGTLAVGELIVTEDGRTRLTSTGKAVVAATREYLQTTSPKKMIIDFADVRDDIGVGAVKVFADWLYEVDTAAREGDIREVSALLTEPGTLIAVGEGVETAAGQLFTKLLSTPVARKGLSYLKRAPEVPDETPGAPSPDYDKVVDGAYADLRDMPTGVPISGQTVQRAGLTLDEHAWMIETAKEHGVAFFARPRPREAAKWARLGYNAKPMPVKFKSVSDIDGDWLGYDPARKGLVVMREPTDPFPAMKEAVERGELEWGGQQIDDILERYNLRKAEWENFHEVFDELNAMNGGEGFDVFRYGKKIRTRLSLDADGTLRMTWNGKPIFSDIDLLQIGRPDGSPIPAELHRRITEAGGFGIDGQHGDSAMTSDFPNWNVAKKVAIPYVAEHARGGDPLVIVQPDVTTLGYVDSYTYPDEVPGSGYDLYGQVQVTYEGAAPR